jgi:hypothetical protein
MTLLTKDYVLRRVGGIRRKNRYLASGYGGPLWTMCQCFAIRFTRATALELVRKVWKRSGTKAVRIVRRPKPPRE